MSTGMIQLRTRIRSTRVRVAVSTAITVYTTAMVLGRLISGVHWFTDIVGGIFLGAGLTQLYKAAADLP